MSPPVSTLEGGGLTVEIEGLDRMRAALQADVLLGEAVRGLFLDMVTEVQSVARLNIRSRTGTLAARIVTGVDQSALPLWGAVRSRAPHSRLVEYGHRQKPGRFVRALGKRLKSERVQSYPFMRIAREVARSHIEDELEEVARLVERRWAEVNKK